MSDTTGSAQIQALDIERRITVKGWKMRDGKRAEFISTSALYSDRTVEYERKRIGEKGVLDWQPHITEVIVEQRYVTPWTVTDGT